MSPSRTDDPTDPGPLPAPGSSPGGDLFDLAPGVRIPGAALRFTFVSSTGPGGQNVNKRATKAQLRVALRDLALRPDALERLAALAGSAVTDAGELLISAGEYRSQGRN